MATANSARAAAGVAGHQHDTPARGVELPARRLQHLVPAAVSTTDAPSSRNRGAVALPIPPPPPVMTTTLPSSSYDWLDISSLL